MVQTFRIRSLFFGLIPKAGMHLVLLAVAVTGFACAARPNVTETGTVLKDESMALKDGGHADVRFEQLTSSYRTRATWLQGLFRFQGGEPSRLVKHFYFVVTGNIQAPSGRTTKFGWIGSYSESSSCYSRPGRLVLIGNDIFFEYTLAPTFSSLAGGFLPLEKTPFYGNPRLIEKYVKYSGTRRHKAVRDGTYGKFESTYKWPVEYLWEDVSKEEFENASRYGYVINADFSNSDVKPFYLNDNLSGLYSYFKERVEPDTEQTRFLHAVKSGSAANVEAMLNRNPELIRVYDYGGSTALHLALESQYRRHLLPLLYRFNPDINAIDFKGRTPLHTAVECLAEEAILHELISKGGRILYGKCAFRERTTMERYGLSDKELRPNPEKNGWVNDDAYQVWVKCPYEGEYPCFGSDVQAAGVRKIVSELGLSGAPDSPISRKIGWIIDNIEIVCFRSHEKISLVRISGPNLRGLAKEYNEQKKQSQR